MNKIDAVKKQVTTIKYKDFFDHLHDQSHKMLYHCKTARTYNFRPIDVQLSKPVQHRVYVEKYRPNDKSNVFPNNKAGLVSESMKL